MAYSLQQVDLVRERMGVGYAQAKQALDEAGGDLIGALAAIDRTQAQQRPTDVAELLIREVRRALEGRRIRKVRLKLGDQTLTEAPVAVGGVAVVLLAVVSALGTHLRLELVSGEGEADRQAD